MNRNIIYLLDRNLVIDIQNFLRDHDATNIARVQKIDVRSNFVSPMLSCIEGKHQRVQTPEEMRATLLEETALLSKFFQRAGTDSEFMQTQAAQFAASFSEENSKGHEDLTTLTSELKTILRKTYALPGCFEALDQILLLARRFSVTVSHPLVVAAVAALFGNASAHHVIKPKKGPTPEKARALLYNAVADFRLLSNFNYIRSFHNGGKRVRLLTRDAALDRFVNSIRLVGLHEKFDSDREEYVTATNLTLARELVPRITTDKNWERFLEIFEGHYQMQDKVPPFKPAGLFFPLRSLR